MTQIFSNKDIFKRISSQAIYNPLPINKNHLQICEFVTISISHLKLVQGDFLTHVQDLTESNTQNKLDNMRRRILAYKKYFNMVNFIFRSKIK